MAKGFLNVSALLPYSIKNIINKKRKKLMNGFLKKICRVEGKFLYKYMSDQENNLTL